jgi:hypothetical protein
MYFYIIAAAVSHIPHFGDAASPAGDVGISTGMRISKGDDTSPVGNDRIS